MNSLKKLESYIVDVDRFAMPVEIFYRGRAANKTRLGACITIATYILILLNTVNLITAYLDSSKQTETAKTM